MTDQHKAEHNCGGEGRRYTVASFGKKRSPEISRLHRTLNIEPEIDIHMYSPSQQNGLLYFSKEMSDSAWVIFLRFRNLRYFPLVYNTSMAVVVRKMSEGYEYFCLIMSLLCLHLFLPESCSLRSLGDRSEVRPQEKRRHVVEFFST